MNYSEVTVEIELGHTQTRYSDGGHHSQPQEKCTPDDGFRDEGQGCSHLSYNPTDNQNHTALLAT